MGEWEKRVKDHLIRGKFKMVEIYDDGTNGSNEVARLKLKNGEEVVQKVMLGVKKYHQSRKALTEVVNHLLDINLGGTYVVPKIVADKYRPYPSYEDVWGEKNVEGHKRVCSVIRGYAPGDSGEDWRGKLYAEIGNLEDVDNIILKKILESATAEKIALLDFITINQDRSARNWVCDGDNFYAIDNGMAWFHEFPKGEWRLGCVIDDVVLQKQPWQFISGVFTTALNGKEISNSLLLSIRNFNRKSFLEQVGNVAEKLGFSKEIKDDWRFEGIIRRIEWIKNQGRFPLAREYRKWHKSSKLMVPEKILKTGGKQIWKIEWDKDIDGATHIVSTDEINYNFQYIGDYLKDLCEDIYEQTLDEEHIKFTEEVITDFLEGIEIESVIDIGCGQGNAIPFFKKMDIEWHGVTLGKDYDVLRKNSVKNVTKQDMHFIHCGSKQYDLVFARHVLEHSPMPLLALMEWHRISKRYLIVVVPNPNNVIEGGKNHYYMLNPSQWKVLFERAGWHIEKEELLDLEYRYLLIKK